MGSVVLINLNDAMPNAGDGGGGEWGTITGTLSAQTDLQAALNNKAALSHTHTKANITDFAHTHAKADITDFAHTHLWADITDKPLTFTPSAHTHTKANITDFAHTHLWADITDKPSTFTPSTHTHLWADITDKPSTFTPSTHTHLWADITDKPSTFTPSTHTHLWADITDKPSTFTPSTHTHLWADITDKPVTFAPSAHSHAWGTLTGTLSDQTDLQTALNAKAETLHTHTAANITSGVLNIAYGGTGNVTVPANGQLLIGNGGGYTVNNITAGTGITVTNGVGTITIASTITPGSAVWGSITGTLSSQTDLNSALAGKANTTHTHLWADITDKPSTFTPTAHNHAATEITSGLLPIARGGTNIGTTPTNGQLLIGNGTGYAVANITAGSGITVTNGAGTITIAATASSVIGFTKTGTSVYAGESESISLTSSGDGVQSYFLGTTGASIINGNVYRSGIFFSESSTLGGTLDVNTSSNMILGSSGCSIRTTTAGSTTNTFRRNSIISANSSNIYSGNSGITSVQNNVIIAGDSNRIGRSTANTYTLSNHCMINSSLSVVEQAAGAGIIDHTFIGTRYVTVSPFIGNSNVLWIGSDPARTTALALNDGPESGHVYNLAGRMSLMPITSKTPQLRFYQRVATANTTLPSPYYHVNLTIDDTALTSNVTFQLPSSNGSSGQFLTTNGSGVTSWANVSLSEVTLSQHTASPNNTVNATRILANAASTNADFVIQPKGTGAIVAQLPDSTATGGNKRGSRAVDLQMQRTLANQVASGSNSFTTGSDNVASGSYGTALGYMNTASGTYSTAIGIGNTCSNDYAVGLGSSNSVSGVGAVALGYNNTASSNASIALGQQLTSNGAYSVATNFNNDVNSKGYSFVMLRGGRLQNDYTFTIGSYRSTTGDGQATIKILHAATTNATPTAMTGSGGSATYAFPSGRNVSVIATIQAMDSSGNGGMFVRQALFSRTLAAQIGTTQTVGTDIVSGALSGISVALAYSSGNLNVNVTGLGATNIQWLCKLEVTELQYS